MPDVIQGLKDLFVMFKIFRGACLLLTLLNIAESRKFVIIVSSFEECPQYTVSHCRIWVAYSSPRRIYLFKCIVFLFT